MLNQTSRDGTNRSGESKPVPTAEYDPSNRRGPLARLHELQRQMLVASGVALTLANRAAQAAAFEWRQGYALRAAVTMDGSAPSA